MSRNSLNFLKNFVKYYILDKYFLKNYNMDDFELDKVDVEVEKYNKYRKYTVNNEESSDSSKESENEDLDTSSISRESIKELIG